MVVVVFFLFMLWMLMYMRTMLAGIYMIVGFNSPEVVVRMLMLMVMAMNVDMHMVMRVRCPFMGMRMVMLMLMFVTVLMGMFMIPFHRSSSTVDRSNVVVCS